jgi:hypothetical protein
MKITYQTVLLEGPVVGALRLKADGGLEVLAIEVALLGYGQHGMPCDWNSPEARDQARRNQADAIELVQHRAADLAPVIAEIRAAGVTSLGGIARELSARHIPATRGGAKWSAEQVRRVLAL